MLIKYSEGFLEQVNLKYHKYSLNTKKETMESW